jgi:hypothetical protein
VEVQRAYAAEACSPREVQASKGGVSTAAQVAAAQTCCRGWRRSGVGAWCGGWSGPRAHNKRARWLQLPPAEGGDVPGGGVSSRGSPWPPFGGVYGSPASSFLLCKPKVKGLTPLRFAPGCPQAACSPVLWRTCGSGRGNSPPRRALGYRLAPSVGIWWLSVVFGHGSRTGCLCRRHSRLLAWRTPSGEPSWGTSLHPWRTRGASSRPPKARSRFSRAPASYQAGMVRSVRVGRYYLRRTCAFSWGRSL